VRYLWGVVIAAALIVPGVLIPYGYEYNAHTASTVGGPLTLGLCIALAVGFDLLVWSVFGLFLIARSAKKASWEMKQESGSV
jgi:hypothetical protein